MRTKIALIAHRCGPSLYPEQTIASARHALSLGADAVEMDVQFTSDLLPVICHDDNTERIFGVDSPVREMTGAQFMQLRHAADRSYPSHTLEDMLAEQIHPLLLHCKVSGEMIKKVIQMLIAHEYLDQTIIGILKAEDVRLIKTLQPGLKTLGFMKSPELADDFAEAGADFIRLWEPWVTQERIDHIHSLGKKVWIMAGEPRQGSVGHTTKDRIRSWVWMGVDGVLIDDVAWALDALSDDK